MRSAALVVLTALAACSGGGGNQATNNLARAAGPAPGYRCAPTEYANGCADVSPTSEHMRGVWVWGDAGRSGFFPDATAAPSLAGRQSDHVYLIFERDFPDDAAAAARTARGGTAAYAIDFDGRRTRTPGVFGYLGEAQNLVIVEHINSLRVLD